VFVNLDDIIFSSTTAEQCSHLLQLFLILRKFDMVINKGKCVFCKLADSWATVCRRWAPCSSSPIWT
jgi:hypothetical protein